jgi:hypothetical protein
VAVKTLPEALALAPERIGRLQREAEALAALNHSNRRYLPKYEVVSNGKRFLILVLVHIVVIETADKLAVVER